MPIPDVAVPFNPANVAPLPGAVTVNGSVDYSTELIRKSLIISGSGTCRIYVSGTISLTGNNDFIKIKPTPSTATLKVEFYVAGKVNIAGNGVVNETLLAANCSFLGLKSCEDIKIAGNGAYIGTVYAPYADVTIAGNGGFYGAVLGETIDFSGNNGGVHVDSSLLGDPEAIGGKRYRLIEWKEE
jgi:hypothetical protein